MKKPIDQLGFGPTRTVCEDGEGGYLVLVTPPKALGLPTVTVNLTADQYARYQQWEKGTLMQNALPDLDPATREMLMTGLNERKTNVKFVTDLMEFSKFGALSQLFVIDALDKWSKTISECDPAEVDTPMINGAAWVGVAKEIQAKLEARK